MFCFLMVVNYNIDYECVTLRLKSYSLIFVIILGVLIL